MIFFGTFLLNKCSILDILRSKEKFQKSEGPKIQSSDDVDGNLLAIVLIDGLEVLKLAHIATTEQVGEHVAKITVDGHVGVESNLIRSATTGCFGVIVVCYCAIANAANRNAATTFHLVTVRQLWMVKERVADTGTTTNIYLSHLKF